jgi:hypothetical protein
VHKFCSVADPGCLSWIPDLNFFHPGSQLRIKKPKKKGFFSPDLIFDPFIRDPGWVEIQHPDPGSGMKNPDHIFLS